MQTVKGNAMRVRAAALLIMIAIGVGRAAAMDSASSMDAVASIAPEPIAAEPIAAGVTTAVEAPAHALHPGIVSAMGVNPATLYADRAAMAACLSDKLAQTVAATGDDAGLGCIGEVRLRCLNESRANSYLFCETREWIALDGVRAQEKERLAAGMFAGELEAALAEAAAWRAAKQARCAQHPGLSAEGSACQAEATLERVVELMQRPAAAPAQLAADDAQDAPGEAEQHLTPPPAVPAERL